MAFIELKNKIGNMGPIKSIDDLREWLEFWRGDCKCKDPKYKCNHKDGPAFIEGPGGKRRYFCHVGCALLQLDNKNLKKAVEYQFNDEGHYETLRNSMNYKKK